jgi:PTH1 family peptidyl-tRNA hydrolase
MVVEQLGARHGVRWTTRGLARVGQWQDGDEAVRLLLPQTMMNASGQAVAAQAERIAPDDLLIVLDEVNLPLGTLRLQPGGSDGGHHGLASCLQALGTQTVPRLRVGVGVEPLPHDLTDFVLAPFDRTEHALVRQTLTRAVEVCQIWAYEGMKGAMNHMSREHV